MKDIFSFEMVYFNLVGWIFQVAHCCGFTEASSCYWIRHHYLGIPLWNGLLPVGLPDLCICAWARYSKTFMSNML